MFRLLSSEWIKYRRTSTMWLLILAPPALVTVLTWYLSAADRLDSWTNLTEIVYQVWTMLFVPTGAALLAGLAASYEVRAGNWYSLRARPIPPATLYAGKLLILMIHTLLSTFLLATATCGVGIIVQLSGPAPLCTLLVMGLLSWLAALPILSLQLLVASVWGFGASIGAGVPGVLVAALIGGTSLGNDIWPFVPWAWPAAVLGPFFGLSQEIEQPLVVFTDIARTATVVGPALCLCAVFAVFGMKWFSSSEIV